MNAPGDSEPGAAAFLGVVRQSARRREVPPPDGSEPTSASVAFGAYRTSSTPRRGGFSFSVEQSREAVFAEFRDAEIHAEPVTRACWIDDAAFVTAAEDGLVGVWSAQTGECAARLRGHERAVTSAVVIPGGAASRDASAGTEDAYGQVSAGVVSEHGVRVVTASLDGTVRVWHVEGELGRACDVLVHDAEGRAAVNALALAPEAGELLSVGDDGVAVCWDVLSSGPPPRRMRAPRGRRTPARARASRARPTARCS